LVRANRRFIGRPGPLVRSGLSAAVSRAYVNAMRITLLTLASLVACGRAAGEHVDGVAPCEQCHGVR